MFTESVSASRAPSATLTQPVCIELEKTLKNRPTQGQMIEVFRRQRELDRAAAEHDQVVAAVADRHGKGSLRSAIASATDKVDPVESHESA